MKKFSVILLSGALLALTGCTALQDEIKLYENSTAEVKEIGYMTYEYHINQPWQRSYINFKDTLINYTFDHCSKKDMAAQMIDFYSKQQEKGMEGTIVFRCTKRLPPPTPGLFFSNGSETN